MCSGFEPKSLQEYNNGNWTQGCVRSVPLTCSSERNNTTAGGAGAGAGGGDGFTAIRGVKLPDFAVWRSLVGDANSCEKACLDNCSCGAYSYSTGSCLTWGQELVDIFQFPAGSEGAKYDLYVKVPSSLLGESLIYILPKFRTPSVYEKISF